MAKLVVLLAVVGIGYWYRDAERVCADKNKPYLRNGKWYDRRD